MLIRVGLWACEGWLGVVACCRVHSYSTVQENRGKRKEEEEERKNDVKRKGWERRSLSLDLNHSQFMFGRGMRDFRMSEEFRCFIWNDMN